VADEEARKAMALDIDQLDAIIDKFMDYARPDDTKTKPVDLGLVIEREAAAFRDKSQIRFSLRCRRASRCMATTWNWAASSPTCSRTRRRYGRTVETGVAKVKVSHVITGDTVIVTVRDYGQGVPPEKLDQLTTPSSAATPPAPRPPARAWAWPSSRKALQRIGASLELVNARDGGLMAHIRLRRAS
jgi:two-component system osmolarity sensor histidine kinase EnvZ